MREYPALLEATPTDLEQPDLPLEPGEELPLEKRELP